MRGPNHIYTIFYYALWICCIILFLKLYWDYFFLCFAFCIKHRCLFCSYEFLSEDALSDIVERTQNFAIHQGYHNCLWYKSPHDNTQSSLSHESSFSKCPSSYSAVLSRDIISKNKEINSSCNMNRCCLDPLKSLSKL